MTWGGPWDSPAWDGPWDGQDGAPPVFSNPAATGTLVIVVGLTGLLVENGGLRATLAITPRLTATMTSIPAIYRGNDVSFTLTVLDAAGAPTSITGDTIEVEVKAGVGVGDPALIRKTVGDGVTVLAQAGPTLGQATVAMTGADTDIAAKIYKLDVVHVRAGVRTQIIPPRDFPILDVVNRR